MGGETEEQERHEDEGHTFAGGQRQPGGVIGEEADPLHDEREGISGRKVEGADDARELSGDRVKQAVRGHGIGQALEQHQSARDEQIPDRQDHRPDEGHTADGAADGGCHRSKTPAPHSIEGGLQDEGHQRAEQKSGGHRQGNQHQHQHRG